MSIKGEKKNKGRLYMLHMYSEYIERAVKEKKSCQNMVRGYPTQKPKIHKDDKKKKAEREMQEKSRA